MMLALLVVVKKKAWSEVSLTLKALEWSLKLSSLRGAFSHEMFHYFQPFLAIYSCFRSLRIPFRNNFPNSLRPITFFTCLPDPVLGITEYVPYGDLLGYLRKSRGLQDTYYNDPEIKPRSSLISKQLFGFSYDIANGMEFLSSKKVTHSWSNALLRLT